MVADGGPRRCVVIFGLFRKIKTGQHDEIRRTLSEDSEREDTVLRLGLDERERALPAQLLERTLRVNAVTVNSVLPPCFYIMEDRIQI